MSEQDINNLISEDKIIEVCNSIIDEIESKIKKNFVHDPLLVTIECSFLGIDFKTWEKIEKQRSIKKRLEMKIGNFHELILSNVSGWKKESEFGLDLVNDNKTVFVEIKNKFNTMNSTSQKGVFLKCKNALKKYPNATVYCCHVISKKIMNKEWSIPSEENNPKIRLIDGKTLYTIVSGNDSFFSYIIKKYYHYITNYYKVTIQINKEISELVYKAYNMNLNMEENKVSDQILEDKQIVVSSNVEENKNHIYSVELFAGCGGLALGLEMAGFENKMLCEIDKNCVKTLSKNRPNWDIVNKDITNVNFTHLKYKVAIVSGGFPCQSWSQAGKRKGFNDERGNLFFQFKRAVNEIKPPIFIGENVQGLVTHNGGKTIKLVKKHLEDIGYIVKTPIVLNSNDFNVAQKRKRLILIGIRKDLKDWYNYLKYPSPLKGKKLVLRDVLKDVPESKGAKYSEEKENIFKLVPPGGCWVDIPVDIQKKYMKKSFTSGGGKRGILRRISWDEPCLTLLTSPSQKQTERCHPDEERPFTIREYARIQSFPDEWKFEGSINKIYKQIGNAVPPNLAYHVGKEIFNLLTKMISKKVFIEDYKTKEIFDEESDEDNSSSEESDEDSDSSPGEELVDE